MKQSARFILCGLFLAFGASCASEKGTKQILLKLIAPDPDWHELIKDALGDAPIDPDHRNQSVLQALNINQLDLTFYAIDGKSQQRFDRVPFPIPIGLYRLSTDFVPRSVSIVAYAANASERTAIFVGESNNGFERRLPRRTLLEFDVAMRPPQSCERLVDAFCEFENRCYIGDRPPDRLTECKADQRRVCVLAELDVNESFIAAECSHRVHNISERAGSDGCNVDIPQACTFMRKHILTEIFNPFDQLAVVTIDPQIANANDHDIIARIVRDRPNQDLLAALDINKVDLRIVYNHREPLEVAAVAYPLVAEFILQTVGLPTSIELTAYQAGNPSAAWRFEGAATESVRETTEDGKTRLIFRPIMRPVNIYTHLVDIHCGIQVDREAQPTEYNRCERESMLALQLTPLSASEAMLAQHCVDSFTRPSADDDLCKGSFSHLQLPLVLTPRNATFHDRHVNEMPADPIFFNLKNRSNVSIGPLGFRLTDDAKGFRFGALGCSGKILEPGENCTLAATFEPVLAGHNRAKIQVTVDDIVAATSTLVGSAYATLALALTGKGKGRISITDETNTTVHCDQSCTLKVASQKVDLVALGVGTDVLGRWEQPCVERSDRCTIWLDEAEKSVSVSFRHPLLPSEIAFKQQWSREFDTHLAIADNTSAITTDTMGNLYVTGTSFENYVTIKYAPDGRLLWTATYNGDGDDDDRPSAIAVDQAGNVYVTGTSWGGGGLGSFTLNDYATVKYDPAGVEQWVSRYTGEGDGLADVATAIAIDDMGRVYVTGSSQNQDLDWDYVTVQYDSTSGEEKWVHRYGGAEGVSGFAVDLAADETGVYITGYTDQAAGSSETDYTTFKLLAESDSDESPKLAWLNTYDGPGNHSDRPSSMAITGESVYVTGTSHEADGTYTYATVRYDRSSGEALSVMRHETVDQPYGRATDLAIDNDGNIFVTGLSVIPSQQETNYLTLKYDSTTNELLHSVSLPVNSRQSPYLSITPSGNVYLGGTIRIDSVRHYLTVKYDQQLRDLSQHIHSALSGYVNDITSIDDEHIYLSGDVFAQSVDFGIARYRGNETDLIEEVWFRRYNSPASAAIPPIISTQGSAGIHVAGAQRDTDIEPVTVQYNDAGTVQWVASKPSPECYRGKIVATAEDDTGIYLAGSCRGEYEQYVTKYDSNGNELWFDAYGSYDDKHAITAIAVGRNGNLYVTGKSNIKYSDSFDDYLTIKYDTSGFRLWEERYNGPGNFGDSPSGIAIDAFGNVYVTGTSFGDLGPNGGSFDFSTLKYGPEGGAPKWVKRHDGPSFGFDGKTSIALDHSGNVVVTGWSRGIGLIPDKSFDYYTAKYRSSNGETSWEHRFDGEAKTDDMPSAIVVDTKGNTYVTGMSEGVDSAADYVTIKYPCNFQTGNTPQWIRRYNGEGNGEDAPSDMALDWRGDIYVTGTTLGAGSLQDYTTIKYLSNGRRGWIAHYNGGHESIDHASSIAVDHQHIYVTGSSHRNDGTFYTTVKYKTGLTHHWKLDGDTLDAISLTPGTPYNITFDTGFDGKPSGAAVFDAKDNSFIDVGQIKLNEQFTLSLWAYVNSTANNSVTLMTNSIAGFRLSINSYAMTKPDQRINFETGEGCPNCQIAQSQANTFSFDEWHHIAVTVNQPSQIATLYYDGFDVTEKPFVRNNFELDSNIELGRIKSGHLFHQGRIDDVRIFDRVLNAGEVLDLTRFRD